jgi:hypothetical protein
MNSLPEEDKGSRAWEQEERWQQQGHEEEEKEKKKEKEEICALHGALALRSLRRDLTWTTTPRCTLNVRSAHKQEILRPVWSER